MSVCGFFKFVCLFLESSNVCVCFRSRQKGMSVCGVVECVCLCVELSNVCACLWSHHMCVSVCGVVKCALSVFKLLIVKQYIFCQTR